MNFNFKTNIAKSILLALILMLVGCSAGDDLTTVLQSKESGKYTLDIDVVETDWDGETISATTRAGETMESLKASYVRSWDFTSLTSKEELLAMSGLTFTPNSPNPEFLKVDTDEKAVKLNGKVTISGLRATQTLTIVYKSVDGEARTLTPIPRNFVTISGFEATKEKETGTARVTTDGEGEINTTGNAFYIYSIELSEAETEGFGLYCSELNYTNTHVKWNSTRGAWIIGNNDYNEYWPIRDERTLDVYAYAPYKSPAYTVAGGVLTFVAETYSSGDLSGSNVDLLYASKVDYKRSSDNPVALEFKHALAKLTFGTITNNTGETLYLNGFTISSRDGNLWKQAKLDLSSGDWSEHVAAEYDKIVYPPPFVTVVRSDEDRPDPPTISVVIPPLPDKRTTIPPMPSRELLVIPDANGKITLNIKVNSSKETEQFSFPVTLEQGKNKTYNITVEKNFEVVIE